MSVRGSEHFAELGRLLEVERVEARRRHAEAFVGRALHELVADGLAEADLEASDETWTLGGRLSVTFERPGRAELGLAVDAGDPVVVAPRRSEDAAREGVPGIVQRRRAREIVVAFDAPPPEALRSGRVVVQPSFDGTTFDRAARTLRALVEAERGPLARVRALVLGRREPAFGPRRASVPAAVELNAEQAEAFECAVAADDVFLVHGPPGTGKSTVLVALAAHFAAAGQRVLLTAASNAAVDHLLDGVLARGVAAVRIGHPARVFERLHPYTLDALVEAEPDYEVARALVAEAFELRGFARRQRVQGRSAGRFAAARGAQRDAKSLLAEGRALEARACRAVLERTAVVAVTASALHGRQAAELDFDVALFDEATQATEPVALGVFTRARRVVLAGDHRQLPPTVLARAAAPLGRSLFERLLDDFGAGVRVMLREQHRMSEALMAFPSAQSYGGELRAHPAVAARRLAARFPGVEGLAEHAFVFVDTAGAGWDEEKAEGSESLANPGEAGAVGRYVAGLAARGVEPGDIGVITPYAAQAALLRARLRPTHPALEIDSVDGFQGREKEVIVLSLVRSNVDGVLGFLADLRRLNVAITRARSHLVVFGDSATVARHPHYEALLEAARTAGGYRSVWELPGLLEG